MNKDNYKSVEFTHLEENDEEIGDNDDIGLSYTPLTKGMMIFATIIFFLALIIISIFFINVLMRND